MPHPYTAVFLSISTIAFTEFDFLSFPVTVFEYTVSSAIKFLIQKLEK